MVLIFALWSFLFLTTSIFCALTYIILSSCPKKACTCGEGSEFEYKSVRGLKYRKIVETEVDEYEQLDVPSHEIGSYASKQILRHISNVFMYDTKVPVFHR